MLDTHGNALVVRTSAFFGPWDAHNFITQAMQALVSGQPFAAANDVIVTPTYVPDLVHTCLDLLIDRKTGIWHLTNGKALTWANLALKASEMAGIDAGTLHARPQREMNCQAPRPSYGALHSDRGMLLPSLDDALSRYFRMQQEAELTDESRQAVGSQG